VQLGYTFTDWLSANARVQNGLYTGPMQTVDLGRAVQRDFMDLRRHYLSAALVPSSKWAQRYTLMREQVRRDLDNLAERLDGPEPRERLLHAGRILADWDVALAHGDFATYRTQIDRLADGFQNDIDQIIEQAERTARSRVDEDDRELVACTRDRSRGTDVDACAREAFARERAQLVVSERSDVARPPTQPRHLRDLPRRMKRHDQLEEQCSFFVKKWLPNRTRATS